MVHSVEVPLEEAMEEVEVESVEVPLEEAMEEVESVEALVLEAVEAQHPHRPVLSEVATDPVSQVVATLEEADSEEAESEEVDLDREVDTPEEMESVVDSDQEVASEADSDLVLASAVATEEDLVVVDTLVAA